MKGIPTLSIAWPEVTRTRTRLLAIGYWPQAMSVDAIAITNNMMGTRHSSQCLVLLLLFSLKVCVARHGTWSRATLFQVTEIAGLVTRLNNMTGAQWHQPWP